MFLKQSFLSKIARNVLINIFNKLENNNNYQFRENGEQYFIKSLFERHLQNNDVVVFDVGANIGAYSKVLLEYAQKFAVRMDLHVFEPTAKCFAQLQNEFGTFGNIHLNKLALSNDAGEAPIYYDEESSGLASLHKRNLNYYNIEMTGFELVNTAPVSQYIEQHHIAHINFLKIDVEGHELKVLQGLGKYLSPDFLDCIQFEYGGTNLDSRTSLMEIYELLEARGFKVAKIMKKGLEIRSYHPRMENFSYSNYVAVSPRILLSA